MLYVRENFAMNLVGEVLSATMTYALVHMPVISAGHPLKVAADATEELRMEANANILAEMSFNHELIRQVQMEIGHLSRLGRSMIQVIICIKNDMDVALK